MICIIFNKMNLFYFRNYSFQKFIKSKLNIMKKSIALLSLIALFTLSNCNQKPAVSKMLENQESRTEIYKAIVDNHDYLMEFMDSIHNNQNAMKSIRQNNMMKCKMMMKDSTLMKSDSTMNCMKLQKRMMNHDCMQSCMKMKNDSTMMKCKMGNKKMMRQRKMMKDSTKIN